MAWELSDAGLRYFTLTRRVKTRRVRAYFPPGPSADLAATLVELRRLERDARARRRRAELSRWQAAQEPLVGLCKGVELAARACLLLGGFYQHHKGEWRAMRRARRGDETPPSRATPEALPEALRGLFQEASGGHAEALVEALRGLVERAEKRDAEALQNLRLMLSESSQLWQVFADLARRAEASLLGIVAGEDDAVAGVLIQRLEGLRKELGGESSSCVERLLVQAAALCRLEAGYLESTLAGAEGLSVGRAEKLRRRGRMARRRCLAALRMLGVVRRLLPAAHHA
jgi:hypothetical protein